MVVKNAIWSVITIGVIILINYGITKSLEVGYWDYALITGIGVSVAIWFLTSSGGFFSDSVRYDTQAMTGMKVDSIKKEFRPSVVFYSSLLYNLITLIVTAYLYKDYF
jgi:hypothetical protein